jgi:GT2 family glycosyltransferase
MHEPLFSIVIPHLRGASNLYSCLKSIYENTDEDVEIILVDNGSKDKSIDTVYPKFPDVTLISQDKNLGFAGGCNVGLKRASGKFIVLLNDDTEVSKGWLDGIDKLFDYDEKLVICQPKLLSYENKNSFEYAGASGGYIDRYCFPFTRGRIFDTIEEDKNQYDDTREIFWGAGAALIFRNDIFNLIGYFDEDFFAHMEEIDFCFRVHGIGLKVISCPKSVVYHKTASTLKTSSFLKMYLNHRNSLFIMLKNYPTNVLIRYLPIRFILDILALLFFTCKGQLKRSCAIITSYLACVGVAGKILEKRKNIEGFYRNFKSDVTPKLYSRSIAIDYYLLKKKKFIDIGFSINGSG